MQSGSDAVLRRMGRRWGARRLIDRCRMVCEALDQPALTTDVMVGFPGETEADFEQTCEVVRQVGFSKIHVFPFSPRRGTPAADMPDPAPKRVKSRRSKRLEAIANELRERYFHSLAGRRLRVLVESPLPHAPGRLIGTSCRYAPVELTGDERLCGQLVHVTAGKVVEGRIRAARTGCSRKEMHVA
jgi:threonylcarbamoyladenosine tRNA methylthiotransferase MtaB